MAIININPLHNYQIEVYTDTEIRFYSFNICICVYDRETQKFTLSDNETHFSTITIKWLNKFLEKFGVSYQDIKDTASREILD